MVCKATFLAAKCCGQYGIVFCSLRRELPVVQKLRLVMLLWTFPCCRLAYFEALITLFVHLSQASSSSQRAILPICEHPSEVLERIPTQRNETSSSSGSAVFPRVRFESVAGKKKKEKKRTSVAELSQHCNNAQIGFGPSRCCKIKAALISTERLYVAESESDSSSPSAQTSTLTGAEHSLRQPGAPVRTDTPCSALILVSFNST